MPSFVISRALRRALFVVTVAALPAAAQQDSTAKPAKPTPARDSIAPAPKKGTKKQGAGKKSASTGKKSMSSLKPPSDADSIAQARQDSILDAKWPVKGPEPLPGSILPAKRIIAYYGNPLSKRMGVLGEYEPTEMLKMLDAEVAAWTKADPTTPVQPALHLIAVVAQGAPGKDGKYRLRMDSSLIEKVAGWAAKRNALVFLDVQVGHATLQDELPRLVRFLQRPNFHLGIDPEFALKDGTVPGKKIGSFDASDVNYAATMLAEVVTQYKLPPKVLVVHRFTQRGVTNTHQIKLDPRVQIVMHMDGFGAPWLKRNTFRKWIKAEPVQFAGWKQFYKARNDNPRTTIPEILKLHPRPLYIHYQ
ncbi:MAG: hypothetical protein NTU67_01535 [Gemmatimonadetes bacterium]|nr:hypothetical protein [Gemmatimonadota bacterium]